jgi:hypothetical protein
MAQETTDVSIADALGLDEEEEKEEASGEEEVDVESGVRVVADREAVPAKLHTALLQWTKY